MNTKNDLLCVTATVSGAGRDAITFSLAELDANFGNYPALLGAHPKTDGPYPSGQNW